MPPQLAGTDAARRHGGRSRPDLPLEATRACKTCSPAHRARFWPMHPYSQVPIDPDRHGIGRTERAATGRLSPAARPEVLDRPWRCRAAEPADRPWAGRCDARPCDGPRTSAHIAGGRVLSCRPSASAIWAVARPGDAIRAPSCHRVGSGRAQRPGARAGRVSRAEARTTVGGRRVSPPVRRRWAPEPASRAPARRPRLPDAGPHAGDSSSCRE